MTWYRPLPQHLFPELTGDPLTAKEPILFCAQCGGEIYSGDSYHDTSWGPYCKACADEDERQAE